MIDYKEGDWVRVVNSAGTSLKEDSEWEVYDSFTDDMSHYLALKDHPLNASGNVKGDNGWDVDRFILIKTKENVDYESNIQRPVLEERKVGKVRMELFDSGFPNAVYEIAKVMTWANENKGYKDNDWKTIPDAENAFKGAAARHRVKQNMQRSFGEDLLNCADEESNITHLAHEAFNVLALLELALVGKIK